MQNLAEFTSDRVQLVDSELDLLIPSVETEPAKLHGAMRWSLFGGGKRFRPVLLMAAGDAFGAGPDHLVRSAAAIEMIHTFSLIHDDLPAMDDDELRRGRATCHRKFGEATAILAGDVLQTLAFKAIAEDEHLSADLRVRIISVTANASGTPAGMVAGQQLDLDGEGKTLDIREIEAIHIRKTAALITASALIGAMIGGANPNEIEKVEIYSSRLGLLFQVTDDLLDVTQSTETIGKTAGKDADAEKATYPGHFGVERTREMAEHIYEEALHALAGLDRDTRILAELANQILTRTR